MDKKKQAELYRQQMGDGAAERQERLADRCKFCWAEPGQPHVVGCRYYGRRVALRKQPMERA